MNDFIINLFNIDKQIIKSFDVFVIDGITEFHITLNPENPPCPFCAGITHSNGYSKPKMINHPVLTDRKSMIVFRNNRYKCNECLKTFSGPNPFAFPSFKNSYLAIDNVMKRLVNLDYTFSMIAELNNLSVTQVQRYFDSYVNFPRIHLPVSIGIDEHHTKMAKVKSSSYICLLVDNNERSLFEVLPSRSKAELKRYFGMIPLEERNNVLYVTIDMWQPYKDIAQQYLKNAIVAVDPFHVVKHLMDCFSRIRLNILHQVEYNSDSYYLLKSWKDLIECDVFLDNEPVYNSRFKRKLNKRQLQEMILNISENLTLGYRLKEMYRNFNKKATESDCEVWFDSLLEAFQASQITEYEPFIAMIKTWRVEILNSFKRPYDNRKLSNALSENINGKIEKYINISNGLKNFTRFRKRCILALNPHVFYAISKNLKTDKYEGKKRGSYNKQR